VPAIYLDQLRAYVAAVEAIYPGRRVRAALLWTDGPRLMQVSPAALARRPP
jgi:ATP-dependent helicase/nuclease subunit A